MIKTAIIVAAGNGTRFEAETPKQFQLLNNKPVLFYSLRAFENECEKIIVVLADELRESWKKLCNDYNITIPHEIASGGNTRGESVQNGLALADDDCMVAIHDAARPLLTPELIHKLFSATAKFGSAVPILKLSDSIREINEEGSKALNRDHYCLVQTPQCFFSTDLKKAYAEVENATRFSDEASLAEFAGIALYLIPGEHSNIKITYPLDLQIVRALQKAL